MSDMYKDILPNKELLSGLKQVKTDMLEISKAIDETVKSYTKLKGATDKTGESYSDNHKKITALTAEENKLNAQIKEREKLLNKYVKLQAKNVVQTSRTAKEVEKQRQAYNNAKRELRQLIKEEQTQEGSINRLKAETNRMTADLHDLNLKTKEGRKEFRRLSKEIEANNTALINYDEMINRHSRKVGNYQKALEGVRGGLSKLSIVGGAIAGAIAGIVKLNSVMSETIKIQNKARFAFGTTGKELEKQTALIKTLSDFYDEDYNTVIESANAFSKEFGITGSQALDFISEGFDKGANNSGEFLDILREYPAQLSQVGFEADETIAIISQTVKQGIFSDKGIDAIKEAGLRLREMTPTTKAALDAIGLTSSEIQRDLENGTKSIRDVIAEVSEKLNGLEEDSKAVGMVMADVFGGAGEDAGLRFLRTLKDINTELGDMPLAADEFTLASKELNKQWNLLLTSFTNSETKTGQLLTRIKEIAAELLRVINIDVGAIDPFTEKVLETTGSFEQAAKNIQNVNDQLAKLEQKKFDVQIGNRSDEDVELLITDIEQKMQDLGEQAQRTARDVRYLLGEGIDLGSLTEEQAKILNEYGLNLKATIQPIEEITNKENEKNRALDEENKLLEEEIHWWSEKIKQLRLAKDATVQITSESSEYQTQQEANASLIQETIEGLERLITTRNAATKATQEDKFSLVEWLETNQEGIQKLGEFSQASTELASEIISFSDQKLQAQIDSTQGIIDSINEELEEKERALDEEIALGEKGAASREDILRREIEAERQRLAEQEEIQKQQLARQKKLQIAQATLNYFSELSQIALYAAENPSNALTGGASGAIIFGIQAAAATARYVANLAGLREQGFKDGTEFLNGPGDGRSDSIPIRASRGERIVPADVNAQMRGIPNRDLPAIINRAYYGGGMDDSRIVGGIKETNRLLGNQQSTNRTGQKIIKRGDLIIIK